MLEQCISSEANLKAESWSAHSTYKWQDGGSAAWGLWTGDWGREPLRVKVGGFGAGDGVYDGRMH